MAKYIRRTIGDNYSHTNAYGVQVRKGLSAAAMTGNSSATGGIYIQIGDWDEGGPVLGDGTPETADRIARLCREGKTAEEIKAELAKK